MNTNFPFYIRKYFVLTTRVLTLFALVVNAVAFPMSGAQAQSGDDGLISYWSFDEGLESTAADTSPAGYGNTGTLMNNPGWASSPFGSALEFNAAADQYVSTLNNSDSLSIPSGGITITAWINAYDVSGVRNILAKDKEGTTARGNYSLAVVDGVLRFGFSQASDYGDNWIDTQTSISPNRWYFVAVAHTFGNSGATAIYIDGVSQPLSEWQCDWGCDPDSAPATFVNDPLYIGKSICNGENFDGLIDEVRVYDSVLSPEEFEYTPLPTGSPYNPVMIFFMPTGNTETIYNGGQLMANYLSTETGLSFEVNVPDSNADTVYGMCQNPDTSMGFMPGFGYVLANDFCGVDVSHSAIRFGWPNYWGEILVPRNSSIETLNDLNGLDWGFPDPSSASGYLAAMAMFNSNGVTPANSLETGDHALAVMELYNGNVDFATAFFSPPIKPEGETPWQPGDDPDIPDAIVNTCDVTQDGSQLVCGDWQVMDARNQVREAAPHVVQALRILDIYGPIMNDALSFGPDFPTELRTQIENAMIAFAATADTTGEWWDSIGNNEFYSWEGIASAVDADYDFTRDMVAVAGITLENWGQPDYNPSFSVRLTENQVHGYEWQLGSEMTLSIDGNVIETKTVTEADWDPNQTFVWFDLGESLTLQAGQFIEMTDGTITKSHTVTNLVVGGVDPDADTVFGTAAPDSQVDVGHIYCDENGCFGFRREFADSSTGEWTADFSVVGEDDDEQDIVDLQLGMRNDARQCDEDGDCTQTEWYIPNPNLVVITKDDNIHGHDWPEGNVVTLTIDDPNTGDNPDFTDTRTAYYDPEHEAPQQTWVAFYLAGIFDVQPGHIVTFTDGITTRQHTVTRLDITSVDVDNDVIYGIAEPYGDLYVDAPFMSGNPIIMNADENGDWAADFSGMYDIQSGDQVRALESDGQGGETMVIFGVPGFPESRVEVNPDGNWVEAQKWELGRMLTVNIDDDGNLSNGGITYSDSLWAEPTDDDPDFGYAWFNADVDILPGQYVTVSDGVITSVHQVTDVIVLEVNPDTDTLSGTGQPGTVVYGHLHECCYDDIPVTVAQDGTWTVDYSGIYDIRPGSSGEAKQFDTNGNATVPHWQVLNPTISVRANYNRVEGQEWPEGANLILTIDDPGTTEPEQTPDFTGNATVEFADWDPSQTWFELNLGGVIDIQPGFLVTVTDGAITKEHTVLNLEITDIDIDNEIVSGIGQPNSPVNIWTCDDFGCDANREEFTDGAGNWSTNFSVPGDQDWEGETADLGPGSWIDSSQSDEDGDQTQFGMNVPNPRMIVFPEFESVEVWGWPDGATVDVSVDGKLLCTTSSLIGYPEWDPGTTYAWINFPEGCNVTAGDLVTVTDGETARTHEVQNLTLTEVNAETDIIAGTADFDTVVYVWPHCCGEYELQLIADGLKNWQADFATVGYDVQAGTDGGRAEVRDENGNSTAVDWNVSNSTLHAVPSHPEVHGHDWEPGSDVTLIIDDDTDPNNGTLYESMRNVEDNPWCGEPCFDLYDVFDLQVGQYVTMTDGNVSKTVQVSVLTVTEVDYVNDVLRGEADEGSTVQVNIWSQDGISRTVQANGPGGTWMVDFSEPGNGDNELVTDINPGDWGRAIQLNPDGSDDGTLEYWDAGDSISGTVYLPDASPVGGVLVEVCTLDNFCRTTLTDGGGKYQLRGLLAGTYNITASPPGTNLPGNLGPIDLLYGEDLFGQDITVQEPPAPPPSPDAVEPSRDGGGTISVFIGDPLTLTTYGDPGGTAVFEIVVLDDGYVRSGPMNETPVGSGTYAAQIAPLEPHHGAARITYTITYPGEDPVETQFFIYIDPSGVVQTVDGVPIVGATVTLLRSDSPDGPFEVVPDGSVIMSPSNRTNPDLTDEDGRFGWDVVAGFYIVRAEFPGCFSPDDPSQLFVESGVLTIPPPVTDLVLELVCPNLPPIANAGADKTVNEGTEITLDGFGSFDPEGEVLTYDWDFDNDGVYDDASGVTTEVTFPDNGVYTVGLLVSDPDGLTDTDTVEIEVLNVAPQITSFTAPVEPVQIGESIDISAFFIDPGNDTHTAELNWGDETSSAGTVTGYFITDTHTYSISGVYTLTLTVEDDDGGTATETYQYVVIYDPEGGFVTGGGWIWSPEGAYTPDPSLTGKATFGFVSKYKKGANVPTGNTEFQFKVADLNFKSTSYDWLVIAGKKAMYKGTGTINGEGEYGFMLSAIDGTPDKFRIKIWDKATEAVVYDNQLGVADDTDPVTELEGGSIVIHKAK